MNGFDFECIIFDLDGTLIDSEPLCAQAYLDTIPELNMTRDEVVLDFRGQKFADLVQRIQTKYRLNLPTGYEKTYRRQVAVLMDAHLRSFPHVASVLSKISVDMCIGSNAPLVKIRHSLALTHLASFFGDKIFSAYEINAWKPSPAVFLHAAEKMGYAPSQCIVIEDSQVGLQAAQAAGMRSLQFAPDTKTSNEKSFHHYDHLIEKLAHI
ncbi:MAG: haloacid dehalogenase [Robiginitomaculum sp.]|nr:MAG: haloacid dehalogenase [Robiginitomaculum sp.]